VSIDLTKLLIISGTAHYRQDGRIVGHGPTTREINQLVPRFERIHHIGCFHKGSAPANILPYSSDRVRLIPVAFAGGDSLFEKASVLPVATQYISTIMRELRDLDPEDDVVHVRCPAPVSLIAIMLMSILRSPSKRWVKYAGNWQPGHIDSIGYVFQRWWLKRNFARAKVTVNGHWPHQPPHITAFVNPCLTQSELSEGRALSGTKPPLSPLRLIFIGEVNEKKGVGRALEIVRRLVGHGLDVSLDVIGDGPQRAGFESQATSALQKRVTFHGWLSRSALGPFLLQAHLMLFPSDSSEGWPKVLSEGMAYGVVPVASDVSSIPQYLRECGVGATFNPYDLESFATAIIDYARHPARWQIESSRSMTAAKRFAYNVYLKNVFRLLELERSPAQL
jgi:glycosyltransferase involved in cell wall biosynthesis